MRTVLRSLSVLLIAGSVSAAGPPACGLIVQVDQSDPAWAAGGVTEELVRGFSRNAWLRVIIPDLSARTAPAFPTDAYNLDSLLNWGAEIGGSFLLYVDVREERLERRKTLHLPLVCHKYETQAVVEGELRLMDLNEGTLKMAEPFRVERKAARVFQATMDDDIGDPDLKVPAPAKVRLFGELEEELAARIIKQVEPVLRGDE